MSIDEKVTGAEARKSKRSRGETMVEILAQAEEEITKTALIARVGLNSRNYKILLGVLKELGLVNEINRKIITTGISSGLIPAALPYALEMILLEYDSGYQRNGRGNFQLALLQLLAEQSPEGLSVNKLRELSGVENMHRTKQYMAELNKEGYITNFQKGASTFYKITPAGTELVESINETVAALSELRNNTGMLR